MPSAAWVSFINKIEKVREALFARNGQLWYRGQSSSDWQILPWIFRESVREQALRYEEGIFSEFELKATRHLAGLSSSWDMLAAMQHYGVPTRLLDWTDRLAVAVFFALRHRGEGPCRIIMLNPYLASQKCLRAGGKGGFICDLGDPPFVDHDYRQIFLGKREWPVDLAVPVVCRWMIDREERQAGFFTFHGGAESPIDAQYPNFVGVVDLDPDAFPDAENYLQDSGIDEFSVFGDLTALAMILRRRYLKI